MGANKLPSLPRWDEHVQSIEAQLTGLRASLGSQEYAELVFDTTKDVISLTKAQIKYVGLLLHEAERHKLYKQLGFEDFDSYKKYFSEISPIDSSNLFLGYRLVRDILLNKVVQTAVNKANRARDKDSQINLNEVSIKTLKKLWRPIAENLLDSNTDELVRLVGLVDKSPHQIAKSLSEAGYKTPIKKVNPCQELISKIDLTWKEYKRLVRVGNQKKAEKLLDGELAELFGELSHAHIIRNDLSTG